MSSDKTVGLESHLPSQEQVVAYFASLEQDELIPYDVFHVLAKRLTQATVEMVPVRTTTEGKAQVLLTQRPAGDPWEHQWHVPGTILLGRDNIDHPKDYSAAFSRILGDNGELKTGVKPLAEPVEFATERRKTRRGPELAVIFWVEVEGEPIVGRFFDIDSFPKNIPEPGVIDHHQDFIPRVVEHYVEQRKSR